MSDKLYNQIIGGAIRDYHDQMLRKARWPDESLISSSFEGIWHWIEKNHFYNCSLWDQEDQARRNDVDPSQIVTNKRNIDRFNQLRNDSIEKINDLVLEFFSSVDYSNSKFTNSETIGSVIDRMSITSLKIHHMKKFLDRSDSTSNVSPNSFKLIQLSQQRDDLISCYNQILSGLKSGEIIFKIYRQHKMYNDSKMNPYLAGIKS